MDKDITQYFEPSTDAVYLKNDGKYCLQSIERKGNQRVPQALTQSGLRPAAIPEIIDLVNEFLCHLCCGMDTSSKIPEHIYLEKHKQKIVGRIIIATDCKWIAPTYNQKMGKYISHDKKYDVIKDQFALDYANDIVWLKFTKDGFLGVVAASFDINYSYDNTSGKLIKMLGKEWNEDFIIIVPITPDMKLEKTRKEIETGLGNYLAAMRIPILDYYSHNNFD